MPSLADIRPATARDAPEMLAILNEIITIGGTTAFEDLLTLEQLTSWYVEGPRLFCCHVAVDSDGKIAGFQSLDQNPELPEDMADIATFARQTPLVRGIGTALFAATTANATTKGLATINAKIRADNVPGLAYYTKMGFRDHSIVAGVPLKDGTPMDRVVKRFQLG